MSTSKLQILAGNYCIADVRCFFLYFFKKNFGIFISLINILVLSTCSNVLTIDIFHIDETDKKWLWLTQGCLMFWFEAYWTQVVGIFLFVKNQLNWRLPLTLDESTKLTLFLIIDFLLQGPSRWLKLIRRQWWWKTGHQVTTYCRKVI